MKVLHVIPSVADRSGGPATAIVPMCRALMNQDVEILLLSTTAGLNGQRSVFEQKGVPGILFPVRLSESFKYSRPLASWLKTNVNGFNAVHIHAVFNHSSVAAAQACYQAEVPYVIRPLGTLDPWSLSQKSWRKNLFWHLAGNKMLRRAAAIHYTSETEKLATEASLGLNHGQVVALGIESNAANPSDLGHFFPQLAGEPYVLVLSRLHPKKNLDVLIDAFAAVAERVRFARWRLVLAGDGPTDYVGKLKSRAAAASLNERIIFTGWLENERKNAVLSGASLLALPSQQENFGLCVMEALSRSVPVLISPNVNLAPEIAATNSGWIAAIDKDSLSEKLAEAMSDNYELGKRGRAGKQLSQKYSWDETARQLIELYRSVIERNGSARVHRV